MGPAALRLLDRLGFVTDDPETWESLPETLVGFRAESNYEDPSRGLCWTLDLEIAEMFAGRHELVISSGTISKRDALAYIAHKGESEVVIRARRSETSARCPNRWPPST